MIGRYEKGLVLKSTQRSGEAQNAYFTSLLALSLGVIPNPCHSYSPYSLLSSLLSPLRSSLLVQHDPSLPVEIILYNSLCKNITFSEDAHASSL